MKERGILFSAPMVRALLAGTKTQTRRGIKLREFGPSTTRGYDWCFRDKRALWNDVHTAWLTARCPYGVPGDRLWVRETHAKFSVGDRSGTAPQCVAYRATCDADGGFEYVNNGDEVMRLKVTKWTPAIFMPRWASRITLEVTEVRVQRVQDISEEDARAEGVSGDPSECAVVGRDALARGDEGCGDCDPCAGSARIYRPAYERLWDEINGAGSWDSSPWVWCVSFNRVEGATP